MREKEKVGLVLYRPCHSNLRLLSILPCPAPSCLLTPYETALGTEEEARRAARTPQAAGRPYVRCRP